MTFDRMLDHARAIAAELGGNWHVEEYRPHPERTDTNDLAEWDNLGAYLVESSSGFKVELFCWTYRDGKSCGRQPGKIEARIWTPRDKNSMCSRGFRNVSPSYRARTDWQTPAPSIAFSMTKKPAVQGKEIVRRLVEPHRDDFDSMRTFLHNEKMQDVATRDLVARLQSVGVKLEKPRNSSSDSWHGWIGPLDVVVTSYGTISVKGNCNNFTEEQALAVKELFDARGWTKRGFEQ